MSSVPPLATKGGFTLLELLLVIVLLTSVIGVAMSGLSALRRSSVLLSDERDARTFLETVLERITRELKRISTEETLLQRTATVPPSGQHLRGELVKVGQARGDSITFIAQDAGQVRPDGGGTSGLVQITYRVAEPERETKQLTLVRDEVPYKQPADKAFEKIMTFPLSESIRSITFRYYDKELRQWREEWNDNSTALPAIIEAEIAVISPKGRVISGTTAVAIH